MSEWIPVSEGLPEDYEKVLVTWKSRLGRGVTHAYFANRYWHGVDPPLQVIAWQPIPEPYEEDDQC